MKNFCFYFALIGLLSACGAAKNTAATTRTETATFQVWGNCGMCKRTIETAARQAGASKADWNMESHAMTVNFDPAKLSLAVIHQKIGEAGYDTDKATGDGAAYAKLHACCQYERKKQ